MLVEFFDVGFVVEFLFWFMDYCLINIVYVNLGGQFFNKTSLVEKLELYLDLGLWLIVMIVFFGFVCMWLVLMICFCWGVCGWLL